MMNWGSFNVAEHVIGGYLKQSTVTSSGSFSFLANDHLCVRYKTTLRSSIPASKAH